MNGNNGLDEFSTNRQKTLTTNLNGNNNKSIVTLDENETDSSVIDSDSDIEEFINSTDDNRYRCSSGKELVNNENVVQPLCESSILCSNNDIKPNIGSIALQNSSDITIGNKTFYQGPVTINQFVYDKNRRQDTEQQKNSNNPGYVSNRSVNISKNQKDFPITTDHSDKVQKKSKWTNKHTLVSAIVVGALASSLLAIKIIVTFDNSGDNKNSSSSDLITNTTGQLRIVIRDDWIALPPKHELEPLHLPVTRVIIAHTVTGICTTQVSCSNRVRAIQKYHMETRRLDDIGYNFLIGGDGAIYIGRGWDFQGAHTKGYNVNSICMSFIGNFTKITPTKAQLQAALEMIEEGVKLNKLTPDYKLYGHCQLMHTESPGPALYDIIKKWDHWTEMIL